MIYLIGGPPRCGKTTSAKKLAKKLGISWISADTLETIVERYTPEGYKQELFPRTMIYRKARLSNDAVYKKYPVKYILHTFLKQAKSVHLAIEAVVYFYHKNNEDVIIEGHQLFPEFVAKLKIKYKKVRPIFLTRFSIGGIIKSARKNTTMSDWVTKTSKNEITLKKIALLISQFSLYYEKEAKKHKMPVFNVDGVFNKEVERVVRRLLK